MQAVALIVDNALNECSARELESCTRFLQLTPQAVYGLESHRMFTEQPRCSISKLATAIVHARGVGGIEDAIVADVSTHTAVTASWKLQVPAVCASVDAAARKEDIARAVLGRAVIAFFSINRCIPFDIDTEEALSEVMGKYLKASTKLSNTLLCSMEEDIFNDVLPDTNKTLPSATLRHAAFVIALLFVKSPRTSRELLRRYLVEARPIAHLRHLGSFASYELFANKPIYKFAVARRFIPDHVDLADAFVCLLGCKAVGGGFTRHKVVVTKGGVFGKATTANGATTLCMGPRGSLLGIDTSNNLLLWTSVADNDARTVPLPAEDGSIINWIQYDAVSEVLAWGCKSPMASVLKDGGESVTPMQWVKLAKLQDDGRAMVPLTDDAGAVFADVFARLSVASVTADAYNNRSYVVADGTVQLAIPNLSVAVFGGANAFDVVTATPPSIVRCVEGTVFVTPLETADVLLAAAAVVNCVDIGKV